MEESLVNWITINIDVIKIIISLFRYYFHNFQLVIISCRAMSADRKAYIYMLFNETRQYNILYIVSSCLIK